MIGVMRSVLMAMVMAAMSLPAAAEKPLDLMMIIAEREYRTDETLPKFAEQYLADDFNVHYVTAKPGSNDLDGMEKLDAMDVVLISVRRRAPKVDQMAALRRFVAAGRPVVGIRKTSHAFNLRGKPTPDGHAVWNDFDQSVLGGHYTGHYHNAEHPMITEADGAGDHPILRGVKLPIKSGWSLYRSSPLAESATLLLSGAIKGHDPEPVAWTHTHGGGGRVFYTSLGHIDDFKQDAFNHLLRNSIYWAAGQDIPE